MVPNMRFPGSVRNLEPEINRLMIKIFSRNVMVLILSQLLDRSLLRRCFV